MSAPKQGPGSWGTIGGELELALINDNGTALDPTIGGTLAEGHLRIGGGVLSSDSVTSQPDYVLRGSTRYGYDAASCTAEAALPVVHTLREMELAIQLYLAEVTAIIAPGGGRIFGGGMQPVTLPTVGNYQAQVRDRAVYRVITGSWRPGQKDFPFHYNWGHRHTAFTAHHSPWTGVAPSQVADALAVAHAFRGVISLLFASSPILGGELFERRDYRAVAWQRFMAQPRIASQRRMIGALRERPRTIKDILLAHWAEQAMWFLPLSEAGSYKGGVVTFVNPPNEPSFLDFLRSGRAWPAVDLLEQEMEVTPSIEIAAENADWWSFWSRFRFGINPESVSLKALLKAIDRGDLEELFSEPGLLNLSAIEWRDFSAGPLDDVMASWACAVGWVVNLDRAVDLVDRFPWAFWLALNDLILLDGFAARLNGLRASALARVVLEIAEEGLRERGLGEEVYLNPLFDRLERGMAPAERMVALFGQGLPAVLEEFSY